MEKKMANEKGNWNYQVVDRLGLGFRVLTLKSGMILLSNLETILCHVCGMYFGSCEILHVKSNHRL